MIPLPPPPTYAQVLVTDPSSGIAKFNPIWLDWFVQLAALVSTSATAFTSPIVFSQYTDYAQIALSATPTGGFTRVSNISFNGGNGFLIQVPDSTANYMVLDSITNNSGYIARRANGTSTAKTALAINQTVGGIAMQGYGATGYVPIYNATVEFSTSEAYTDAAAGAEIIFRTTLNGTIVPAEVMRLGNNGNLSVGGAVGAESALIVAIAGSTRWVTIAGSAAGNPTLGVSAGKLAVSSALVLSQVTLLETSVALTNNAAAAAGTLNNAPVAGNPTKWFPINDNGTVRNIPAW